MIYPVKAICRADDPNGEPCFSIPLKEILATLDLGWAIQILKPVEYMTLQQRRWFKGVLLPALSRDNGETVRWWQKKLVTAIFPEDIEHEPDGTVVYPSIRDYGKKKMNTLIEESVSKCHEWGFLWVTLPDSDLRNYS